MLFAGIDDGADIDKDILVGIYERVKVNEFKPGSDHVTQVMKVQSTIVGKKPVSNESHNFLQYFFLTMLFVKLPQFCVLPIH